MPNKRKRATAPPATPIPWRRFTVFFAFLLGLGILLLLVLAYSPAIRGPLLFDDNALPYGQRQLRDAPLRDWVAGVRPLLMFTYWLNYQMGGGETFGYHALNLLLHIANGLMVFFLLRILVPG